MMVVTFFVFGQYLEIINNYHAEAILTSQNTSIVMVCKKVDDQQGFMGKWKSTESSYIALKGF